MSDVNNNGNGIKAAVFDVDGTLSPDISWTKLTQQLGFIVPHHVEIYEKFKSGALGYEAAKNELLMLWNALGPLKKSRLAEIFENWELKKDAAPIFQYLKSKGYITCLITGSVDLFAEVVAKKVGADFWYANADLIWGDNDTLVDLIYDKNASWKKLQQLKEFCASNSLNLNECAVVGDDSNDIEIFKATGRGIAVESPTSEAVEPYAWRKVADLEEIKGIL